MPCPGGADLAFGEALWLRAFLRGGEAFIVAKAILPSSRSTPPGHAAVLRCGMCCFAGGAMDFTVLDIVGYADIDECTTL